tara:strand:+ start:53 stop:289 length:237 start_codon:yes stop_codon:yes gene_type:complete
MKKEQKLYELSKELVYQMTGNYTENVQDADFQIAWTYLNKAMDYIHCCTEFICRDCEKPSKEYRDNLCEPCHKWHTDS